MHSLKAERPGVLFEQTNAPDYSLSWLGGRIELRHELLVLRVPLPLKPGQPLGPPVPPAPGGTPLSRVPLRAAPAGGTELQSGQALAAHQIAALEAVVHLLNGRTVQGTIHNWSARPQMTSTLG